MKRNKTQKDSSIRSLPAVVGGVAAIGIVLAGGVVANAAGPDAVNFTDQNFKNCVAAKLGVSGTSTITEDQMATATANLDCSGQGITSIEGAQYLTNIERILLLNNNITDISPVSGLNQLLWLNLSSNNVTDISPVSGLTNLTELNLMSNNVSDITPISGLTKLQGLDLGDNNVTNLNGMQGLADLERFGVYYNEVSDLSPLSGLTNLTFIDAHGADISDITPLQNLTSLTAVALSENTIQDITPLANLTNLNVVDLALNSITDISPLANLTQVSNLRVNFQNVALPSTDILVPVQLSLRNLDGSIISPSSVAPQTATYDATNGTIVYNGYASYSINWDVPITVGSVTTNFAGNIKQVAATDYAPSITPKVTVRTNLDGTSDARLDWDAVTDTNNHGTVTSYTASYMPTGGDSSTLQVLPGVVSPTVINGLKPQTSYDFFLSYATTDGAVSLPTAAVTVVTPGVAPAPTNVNVSDITDKSATITWDEVTDTANNGSVVFYNVTITNVSSGVSETTEVDPTVSGTKFAATGLLGGTQYSYTVSYVTDKDVSSSPSDVKTFSTTGGIVPVDPPVNPPAAGGNTNNGGAVVYANCDEAAAAGAKNIKKGEPGYDEKLDRDGDGVACEDGTSDVSATSINTNNNVIGGIGSIALLMAGVGLIAYGARRKMVVNN